MAGVDRRQTEAGGPTRPLNRVAGRRAVHRAAVGSPLIRISSNASA